MARDKQASSGSWVALSLPSFLSGCVVGAILPLVILSIGSSFSDTEPDTSTFPDIESVFPNTRFEFYDMLEGSSADREGVTTTELIISVDPATEAVTDQLANVQSGPSSTGAGDSSRAERLTGYMLQTGSFVSPSQANAFRASLLLKGYNAYITPVAVADGGVRHRVLVGPYYTRTEGERQAARLKLQNVSAILLEMRQGST